MKAAVLTQGDFAGKLILRLISEEQERHGIDILVEEGKNYFYSVARNLLAADRIPLAVVIDARTAEPEAASDRQFDVEEVIGDAAGRIPFRVIVAIPELEILFFHRPELLQRLFGKAVTEHLMELGELSPKRALKKLAPNRPYEDLRTEILKALNDSDIQALRADPLIQNLIDFIEKVAARAPRSAASGV